MVTKGNILCWNCRGAASKAFEVELRQLMREFRQKIVILLEPRISGAMADMVCAKFGRKRWARSEALGFSGGVWVIWDEEEVELQLLVGRRSFFTHGSSRTRR